MNREIDVHIQTETRTRRVGRLWLRAGHGRESASFEYADAWLASPQSFSLDPALPLSRGAFHAGPERKLFACLTDCAPDRWGRTLMTRREMRRARQAGETPRTLLEADFLLLVNDAARQGALRFTGAGGSEFLAADGEGIPSLLALGDLLSAATHVHERTESERELRMLAEPGSSLGGARPKASVRDARGNLWVAKFPQSRDEWDVPLWEYVALQLAGKAGITIPPARLETVAGKNVLLSGRFDRAGENRIPFVSAMTLLGSRDGERRSYVEIAEILAAEGAAPRRDMAELWRRMVFNIMIANVDDHLRNHGFLRNMQGSRGWRLSPVYDLESAPPSHKAPIHHTFISLDDGTASLDLALSVAEEFGLSSREAAAAAAEVVKAVGGWRDAARKAGASAEEMEFMESAFRNK
jgi:serine/threonine-protein kinase HipA